MQGKAAVAGVGESIYYRPGASPDLTVDSSHIVGTLGSAAAPTPIYTGDCEADAMVPTIGSP